MLAFLRELFAPTKRKHPKRKVSTTHHTGKVAIIAADRTAEDPLHSMEAVTVLPVWYLNNSSFEHVQFLYPSDELVAPVIKEEDREALKQYVRNICPEPDSSLTIYQKLDNPDASVKEVSALVASDPMLAAQILK